MGQRNVNHGQGRKKDYKGDGHTEPLGVGMERYYLLEAANSVRRCDSEFRRYYDLKFFPAA